MLSQLHAFVQPLQAQWVATYKVIQLAKAESDAMVEEGRRITGWPKPISLREKFAAIAHHRSRLPHRSSAINQNHVGV
jgi:hypothetical protein